MLIPGLPVNVSALLPKVIVLALVLLADSESAVTLKFLVSKVPLVTVIAVPPVEIASASSTEPP